MYKEGDLVRITNLEGFSSIWRKRLAHNPTFRVVNASEMYSELYLTPLLPLEGRGVRSFYARFSNVEKL